MVIGSLETKLRTRAEKARRGRAAPVQPPRSLRVVGYVRQGFDEMSDKRTSREGQRARIAEYADANDWHLVQTYQDIGWSGQDLNRPGLLALLSSLDFEILVVDRTDRLTCKKKDLDFLLALLEKHGITCVPATWSWEPLAQYMRWSYRRRANAVYALLDSSEVETGLAVAKGRASAGPAKAAA